MRHDPEEQRREARKRDDDERRFHREKRDAGPPRRLPSRDELHRFARESAAAQGGEILSIDVRRGDEVRIVADALSGGATTDFLIAMLREFRRRVEDAGGDPRDLRIEFESPGEQRVLLRPEHFDRYRGKAVRVQFSASTPQLKGTLVGAREGLAIVRDAAGAEHAVDPAAVRWIRLE